MVQAVVILIFLLFSHFTVLTHSAYLSYAKCSDLYPTRQDYFLFFSDDKICPRKEGQSPLQQCPTSKPPRHTHTTTDKCVVPSKDSLANLSIKKVSGPPPNPGT